MGDKAITRLLDRLTGGKLLHVPQEQVVIERGGFVIVGQDALLEAHVRLVAVVGILVQNHRAVVRVDAGQAPRQGGFSGSRAAADSDDEGLA